MMPSIHATPEARAQSLVNAATGHVIKRPRGRDNLVVLREGYAPTLTTLAAARPYGHKFERDLKRYAKGLGPDRVAAIAIVAIPTRPGELELKAFIAWLPLTMGAAS